ncbi:hypothetical protein V1525DRAFT_406306, partial [Lipomyces kononenkoae]
MRALWRQRADTQMCRDLLTAHSDRLPAGLRIRYLCTLAISVPYGFKYQGVTPDGCITSLFGAMEGKIGDWRML